jgi:phenylpropionate dioxygenase-like ring-hydroxylating dioxygenase large terminal subunit
VDRTSELNLLRQLIDTLDRKTHREGDRERLVDVRLYTDPARFAQERERWHSAAPNLAAHASELPAPGDFVTREVLGQPVLLVRGDDGRARAFLNVCRHRGARVERSAKGRCRRFVCPYHAWSYGRDGALAGVRLPGAFPGLDRATSGLTELPCTEHAGFLWVAPRPGTEGALEPALAALLTEVEALGPERPTLLAWSSRVWAANWKLLVEGGIESYHFAVAHKGTVGPLFVDTGSQHSTRGRHARLVLPRRSLRALRASGQPEAEWRLVAHANVLYSLAPNAVILVQDGHYVIILMTPLAVDLTRVDIATVGRGSTEGGLSGKARAFLQANHDFTVRTLEEDFVIGEEIQQGLTTGANRHLRFGAVETALMDFHDALEQALAP